MVKLDSSQLHIGMNRQFFFDNRVVERVQDLKRSYHKPKACPDPLITADRPWEDVTYFLISSYQVLKDRNEKWHCWYNNWEYDPYEYLKKRDWYSCSRMNLCYAYSDDGINWIKPGLCIKSYKGQDTNIVVDCSDFGSLYNATPIEDPFETDPAKRFKTLGINYGTKLYRVIAAYSGDGIHWNIYDRSPCFGTWGNNLSDETVLGYDCFGKIYTAAVRSPYQGEAPLTPNNPSTSSFIGPGEPGVWWKYNKRRIFITESSDMLHWSQPQPMLQPDEFDNLDESYFGMCQTRIGDTHIGFVNIFHECDNTIDVRLAYSYDGRNWDWLNNRKTWMESCGLSGREWDSVLITLGTPPIEVGDEHWIYYGGSNSHHDWCFYGLIEGIDHREARDRSSIKYCLGLAKIRLDGFVSIDTSPHREGILVTRPIAAEGNRLVINAKAEEGGYIEVEAVDPAGNVIPGYGRKECDTFTGDDVRHIVTWNHNPEAKFKGYCKLRFYMRKASLFTFQSADVMNIKSSADPDVERKLAVSNWLE